MPVKIDAVKTTAIPRKFQHVAKKQAVKLDSAAVKLMKMNEEKNPKHSDTKAYLTTVGGATVGASAGATIGTCILPGIGTAVGACVGAAVGVVGGLFASLFD